MSETICDKHRDPPRVKASVFMVTYNQEPFVAQAIESVMMQDFAEPFELVVGDDDSGDATRAIAEELAGKHPQRMRLLARQERMGGRANFIRTMGACRGEYLAQLDGDDYWTHPTKLRRQVEFLDANADCAWCFHASVEMDEQTGKGSIWRPEGRRSRYALPDIARRNLASSCTVVFRRGLFGEFPDWFWEAPFGDWPLHVMNARHGAIGYLDEVWAVHRHHAGGVWTGKGQIDQLRSKQKTRDYIERYLHPDCREAIREGRFADNYRLARELERLGDLDQAREQLNWCREHLDQRGTFPAWKIRRRTAAVSVKSWFRRRGSRGAP